MTCQLVKKAAKIQASIDAKIEELHAVGRISSIADPSMKVLNKILESSRKSKWLLNAIINGLASTHIDINMCIQTTLETSSIVEIKLTFGHVLGLDWVGEHFQKGKKDLFLKHCVQRVINFAAIFENESCLCDSIF